MQLYGYTRMQRSKGERLRLMNRVNNRSTLMPLLFQMHRRIQPDLQVFIVRVLCVDYAIHERHPRDDTISIS